MSDIHSKISQLSNKHVLKAAPESYVAGFIAAATNVYPPAQLEKILQNKFFIPDDSKFDLQVFLQSASELTVQNHLKSNEHAKKVAIEKQVHPPKDVDCYYEVEGSHVSLEVKCAVEKPANEKALTLKTAGRIPNHRESFSELKGQLEVAQSDKSLELGRNKDNTLKDFLISAHSKFSPASGVGVDDLNILFVACDDYFNMQDWFFYMFAQQGLFTKDPFHPTADFGLVDVVILSNVKYCHTRGKDHHDWTLKDVFILPFLNPNRRLSALSESILKGLSVFDHHLKKFSDYEASAEDPGAAQEIAMLLKVNSYTVDGLNHSERKRYFPTIKFKAQPVNPPAK